MSWFAGLIIASSMTCLMGQSISTSFAPRYTADGQLTLPSDYREWVFLSSGLGMNYALESGGPPAFTNVFVNPPAYRYFVSNGTWPDNTVLVLEVRASASKGSIIRGGLYQSDIIAVEAEVKDRKRFLGTGWVFFSFGKSSTGKILPHTEDCYSCHLEHAAVDNTFVQFYPVLLGVAKQKGTLKP